MPCLLSFGTYLLASVFEWFSLEELGRLTIVFSIHDLRDHFLHTLELQKYLIESPPQHHFLNKSRLIWCREHNIRISGVFYISNFLAFNFPGEKSIGLLRNSNVIGIESLFGRYLTNSSVFTLESVLGTLIHLTKIELVRLQTNRQGCEDIIQSIGSGCAQLTDLTFTTKSSVDILTYDALFHINFRSLTVTSCSGHALQTLVGNSPNITHLDAQRCPGIGNCTLLHVTNQLKNLLHLNISNNGHFFFPSNLLLNSSQLTSLNVSGVNSTMLSVANALSKSCPCVTDLDVSNSFFSDNHIYRMFRFTTTKSKIRRINITGTSVTSVGAEFLCEHCCDLNCVAFDDSKACAFVFIMRFKEINCIDLSPKMLIKGRTFQTGDLPRSVEGKFLKTEHAHWLGINVSYFLHFRHEVLWDNMVYFNFNCLAVEGFSVNDLLAQILGICKQLSTFHLINSQLMTEDELVSLSSALSSTVDSVGFEDCSNISDTGLAGFVSGMSGKLKNFTCKNCDKVTVSGLLYVLHLRGTIKLFTVIFASRLLRKEIQKNTWELIWNVPFKIRSSLRWLIHDKVFEYDSSEQNAIIDVCAVFNC